MAAAGLMQLLGSMCHATAEGGVEGAGGRVLEARAIPSSSGSPRSSQQQVLSDFQLSMVVPLLVEYGGCHDPVGQVQTMNMTHAV